MKSKGLVFLSLCLLAVVLPTSVVLADTGPKPTMEFKFAGGDVTIVSGILYECDQPDCSDAEPLADLGPQGLYCETTSCRAIGYGFTPYHILEIEFSDGTTRASNIFETAGFDSKYNVTVGADDLLVEAKWNLSVNPRTSVLVLACVCMSLVWTLVVAGVIFLLRRFATN